MDNGDVLGALGVHAPKAVLDGEALQDHVTVVQFQRRIEVIESPNVGRQTHMLNFEEHRGVMPVQHVPSRLDARDQTIRFDGCH